MRAEGTPGDLARKLAPAGRLRAAPNSCDAAPAKRVPRNGGLGGATWPL